MAIAPPQPSLLTALQRLVDMAGLPSDWDSAGAEPPSVRAMAAACYLIEAVAVDQEDRARERVVPTTSSPIPDGGLQVEWQGHDARIDVQANPDGSYGYLVKGGQGNSARYEEADEAPLNTVLSLVDRVLGR